MFLAWDSEFFGYRIGRITANQLNGTSWAQVEHWCTEHQIDLLYFLADPSDPETIAICESAKYTLTDIRIVLEKNLSDHHPMSNKRRKLTEVRIRPASTSDIPRLQQISAGMFTDSRFYNDPRLVSQADFLYSNWVRKSCEGYAESVLVAEVNGEQVGFISAHLENESHGKIGLIGVQKEMQGLGIGRTLVNHCLEWFVQCRVATAYVVTQERNVTGLRLYERCGFSRTSRMLWYHKWFI